MEYEFSLLSKFSKLNDDIQAFYFFSVKASLRFRWEADT